MGIAVENVSKQYGSFRAVDSVSLEIKTGSLVALLGPKVRKELRMWLRRLHEEVHVTTVFVTHDQEEARSPNH